LAGAGADVNARFYGPHKETALHWAASSNDVAALDALLDVGADIEAPGAVLGGGPPLADALGYKQWDAAFRLVKRGAKTTLVDAATLGLIDRVTEHLERNGMSDLEASAGASPGVSAGVSAEVSPEAITRAFWGACHGGREDCARVLLESGANLNWVPPWEQVTPLDAAMREGAQNLVLWLKKHRAKSASEL
jgi:uncharacterized protein